MTDRNANRPGYKKTKVGWIPEDWGVTHLEEISEINKDTLPASTPANYSFIYISLGDVDNGIISNSSDQITFSTAPSRARRKIHKGDILLSTVRPYLKGFTYIDFFPEDIICSTGFAVITPSTDINGNFLYQYIFSEKAERYFNACVVGSNYPALNNSDVEKMSIPLPRFSEQKKIAEILSTWDRAIEQTQQLIDAKQRLKKGLMQQLLTGRMRFPGFGAPVEKAGELPEGWEEKKLAEVAKVIISGVDKKTKKDEIPVFLCNYMDVFQNQYITSDCNFMVASATKAEIEKYKLQKNDVLLTKDSETREDIANSAIMLENIPDLICGYHLAILRPKDQFVDGLFLAYIINFGTFHNYFVTRANGVTRFGVTIESIKGLMVRIPNLVEQKKIAFSLLNLDNEQKLLIQRVNLLKKQKGGLMQKLLNGEVRAKV
jgi:type I restriction enzyme S subunit